MSSPIILHCHIFKNAGSSVVAAFRRAFGERVAELEPDHPDGFLAPSDVERHLARRPDTVMVSSHRARLPWPAAIAGRRVLPLVFLRDPIERLGSVHRFARRGGQPGALGALARATTLEGFLHVLVRSGLQGWVGNVQAGFLSESPVPDLARAAENLAGAMVGLVEHYSDSMGLVEREMRRWHPGCDLSGASENATRERSAIVSDAALTLRELGPAMAGMLLAKNRVDMSLYAHAAAALAQRMAEPGAAAASRDFRARQGDPYDNEPLTPGECPSARAAALPRGEVAERAGERGRLEGHDAWIPVDAADPAGTLRIAAVRVRGAGPDSRPLFEPGEHVRFEMKVEWLRAVAQPIVGFTVRDRFGRATWCMNTAWTDRRADPVDRPQARVYALECALPQLNGGLYTLDADAAEGPPGAVRMLASAREAAAFGVVARADPVPAGPVFVADVSLATHAAGEMETAAATERSARA